MAGSTIDSGAKVLPVAKSEIGYGARFLSRHGWRVVLAFFGVLLPLIAFASLVNELREGGKFFFDAPIMLALHQRATIGRDAFFVLVSKLGYLWGVLPLDVLITAWLVFRRQFRDGLFFGLSVLGSLIINLVAKHHFARVRPDLWLSLTPEMTYSFPSGHAMGSVTLGLAVILLCWNTRWRWPVLAGTSAFVFLVGVSRVYLGVHYPSDILAGWTAGAAWVLLMHQLVAGHSPTPPSTPAAPASPDQIAKSSTAKAASAKQPAPGRG